MDIGKFSQQMRANLSFGTNRSSSCQNRVAECFMVEHKLSRDAAKQSVDSLYIRASPRRMLVA